MISNQLNLTFPLFKLEFHTSSMKNTNQSSLKYAHSDKGLTLKTSAFKL